MNSGVVWTSCSVILQDQVKKKKVVIHSWLFSSSTLHLLKDVCFFALSIQQPRLMSMKRLISDLSVSVFMLIRTAQDNHHQIRKEPLIISGACYYWVYICYLINYWQVVTLRLHSVIRAEAKFSAFISAGQSWFNSCHVTLFYSLMQDGRTHTHTHDWM